METWKYVIHVFFSEADREEVSDIAESAAIEALGYRGELAESQRSGFVEVSPGVWGVAIPATEALRAALDASLGAYVAGEMIGGPLLIRRIDAASRALLASYAVFTPGPVFGDFGDRIIGDPCLWSESVSDAIEMMGGGA